MQFQTARESVHFLMHFQTKDKPSLHFSSILKEHFRKSIVMNLKSSNKKTKNILWILFFKFLNAISNNEKKLTFLNALPNKR